MPIKSKYLFVVSMDVDPAKEALFNEVYDQEHIPNLMKVAGVQAVARAEGEPFAVSIGGEEKKVRARGPALHRPLRDRQSRCAHQRGLGQGRRGRPLA